MAKNGSIANFGIVPLRIFLLIAIPYFGLSKLIGFDIGLNDAKVFGVYALSIPVGLILIALWGTLHSGTIMYPSDTFSVVRGMIIRTVLLLGPGYFIIIKYFRTELTVPSLITLLIVSLPIGVWLSWMFYTHDC